MLITVNELCSLIKVSRNTISVWRKQGLPYEKFGKIVRFDEDAVMDWLRAHGNEDLIEVDIEDIIFKQTSRAIAKRLEGIDNKPLEEQLSVYNHLAKFCGDISISNKKDLLAYIEKWNIEIDKDSTIDRFLKNLNDKEFDGIMVGGLIKERQDIRAYEIGLICSNFSWDVMRERNNFNPGKISKEELEDKFDGLLCKQQKFLEKITMLILKNKGDVLDRLPTDDDIQELYNISKSYPTSDEIQEMNELSKIYDAPKE